MYAGTVAGVSWAGTGSACPVSVAGDEAPGLSRAPIAVRVSASEVPLLSNVGVDKSTTLKLD